MDKNLFLEQDAEGNVRTKKCVVTGWRRKMLNEELHHLFLPDGTIISMVKSRS